MGKNLELQDLKKALNLCKDSYEIYRIFWNITGQTLLYAWSFSVERGVFPASHEESVITLLPKDKKDAGEEPSAAFMRL
jgi:hypothetical protein